MSKNLVDHVNTLQGTDSHFAFSTGNTLPLVTRPHGMTAWIPQTGEGRWCYDRRAPKIQGFRSTRQPSPWIADYGQFLIAPATGDKLPLSTLDTESYHRPEKTTAKPHHYKTTLERHQITAEITATERAAHIRYTYDNKAETNAWLYVKLAKGTRLTHDKKRNLIIGTSTANQGSVTKNFGSHFIIQPDTQILAATTLKAPIDNPDDPENGKPLAAALTLKLKLPTSRRITLKIGTSLISHAQARINLDREIANKTFDQTLAQNRALWNRELSVIEIETTSETQLRTFYSCLYRTFIFPRAVHEYDAKNKQIHYSPYTGKTHPGPLYTDSGFWDIYRTLLPLLTITKPDLLGEMIQGWINAYKEGGWLPSWSSPGYRHCMIGSHSTAVITDAYRKNIRNYNLADAYAAIRKDLTQEPLDPAAGRAGLNAYLKHGYVPSDKLEHSACATLDYAHCDYAGAALACALGHDDDAQQFLKRATNYKNLYDPKTGFIRGRLSNGKFPAKYNPDEWSRDYIEGSAWQHTWGVPHDAAGLIKLMGGDKKFVARLNHMMTQEPRYTNGNYPCEIHEMTEMAAANFGQYAHSNQPVHHVLYLYTCAGRPEIGRAHV